MNEQLEINGDLRDEWQAIQRQEAEEREEALSEAPCYDLEDEDYDEWYRSMLDAGGYVDEAFEGYTAPDFGPLPF